MPSKAELFLHELDNLQIYYNGVLQVLENLSIKELLNLFEWWAEQREKESGHA